MSGVKFQSRTREITKEGDQVSMVYFGSHDEMSEMLRGAVINRIDDEGRLKSVRLYQESPTIWCCEKRYARRDSDEFADAPSEEYGVKSATLDGGLFSRPLRQHPNYRMCWDHQLAAAPGVHEVPSWWENAATEALSVSDELKYRWQKPGDALIHTAAGNWTILKAPIKPGVETFDWATYTITERAKFRSSRKAGKMVANALNRIDSPCTTFGIADGDWKCDHASISWNGNCWVAQLTWTRSGDDEGWDKDLYQKLHPDEGDEPGSDIDEGDGEE